MDDFKGAIHVDSLRLLPGGIPVIWTFACEDESDDASSEEVTSSSGQQSEQGSEDQESDSESTGSDAGIPAVTHCNT